jgi:NTP pyrophosphatase (non-canonical NTP hydrolase)
MKDINAVKATIAQFAHERDWDKFHSPKNLIMALSVEVAELMEHFQWLSEAESFHLNEITAAEVRDEIADVQVYLIRLADKLNIDILQAVEQKMEKNRQKYPIEKTYGSARKYTDFTGDR